MAQKFYDLSSMHMGQMEKMKTPFGEKPQKRKWETSVYTDDVLCISENPERTIRTQIGKYFELKEESIGPSKIYLG